jgi:iron complex transport system substrate-binding protein
MTWLMLFAAACVIGCCSGETAQSEDAAHKTITDMRGVEVLIPKDPQRMVVMDDGTVESIMVIFGVADRIVGLPRTPKNYTYNYTSVTKNETYWYRGGKCVPLVLYPELVNATVVGRNVPNYETVASLSPDLMILNSGSCSFPDWKKDEKSEKVIEMIENMGIPVIVIEAPECSVNPDLENLYKEITILGEVFGKKDKANQVVSFLQEQVGFIEERTRGVPEKEQPSVLFFGLSSTDIKKGGVGNVNGKDTPEDFFLHETVHARNAYSDSGKPTVSAELVLAIDPDIILLPTSNGYHPPRELYESEPFQSLSELSAVKNHRVYSLPWTPSRCATRLEFPIDLMIAAKASYPEKFSDTKIHEWVLDFYSGLYGVDEETALALRSAQWLDWTAEEDF